MAKKRYQNADDAKAWLSKAGVEVGTKVVARPKVQFASLRVWGTIDYLTNFCGFVLVNAETL